MRNTFKPNQLSAFFLLVFVSQLFLLTVVSFSIDSSIVSFDTELTSNADFSDELDSEEGDLPLLLEEELEKEYYSHSEGFLLLAKKKNGFFTYFPLESLLFHFNPPQPPEVFS
jgi:hypothetical protein